MVRALFRDLTIAVVTRQSRKLSLYATRPSSFCSFRQTTTRRGGSAHLSQICLKNFTNRPRPEMLTATVETIMKIPPFLLVAFLLAHFVECMADTLTLASGSTVIGTSRQLPSAMPVF